MLCAAATAVIRATNSAIRYPGTGGYFYTTVVGEIAALDSGAIGGWQRTGKSFGAVTEPARPFSRGQGVVYRFWGTPNVGSQSHFFTRDRNECYAVDKSKAWQFEGAAFWTEDVQADGSCVPGPDGTPRTPLYRLWRSFGESVRRMTTDPTIVESMKAQA